MPFAATLDHYQILTAMLAPALFMTATASLTLSANNRLARVVDRLRVLFDELEAAPEPLVVYVERQIDRHRRRSRIILRAVRLLYLALSAFVATSLSLAIEGLSGVGLWQLPTLLALLGVLLMLVACLNLSREIGMAVQALDDEFEQIEAERRRLRG
jgi:hypothetical protein